jgi:hypothetical protein
MSTYKDFDSRELFVRSLNLFHYNKSSTQEEFRVLHDLVQNFDSELAEIKQNLNEIKTTWNDQSVAQIEKSVANMGAQQLNIMAGQKNDKLQAGYMPDAPMYRIKTCTKDSVFYQLADVLGLEYPCARYHVQFPGEVTAWHTDIFSPAHEFLPESTKNFSEDQIGQDQGIRRVLIALEDWNWGHSLVFGASVWKQWRAGDIACWDYGVPHCAANMGFTPRISVSITGLATAKYHDMTYVAPAPDQCYRDQAYFIYDLNSKCMDKMKTIKADGQDVERRLEYLLLTIDHAITRLKQVYNTNTHGITSNTAYGFYCKLIEQI